MKRVLLTFFILSCLTYLTPLRASHIVGGEILITHISGFQYEMRVNIYRDASGIPVPIQAAIVAYPRGNGSSAPIAIGQQPQNNYPSNPIFQCTGVTWCLPKDSD